jgi:predicted lipid-binding transport protein (Tim44 family)
VAIGPRIAQKEGMNEARDTPALSVTDTAKGIAVRAGVLAVGGIIVGTWLFSLAAKAAGGMVKIVAGTLLLAIGGGVAAWELKKFRKRFTHDTTQPEL